MVKEVAAIDLKSKSQATVNCGVRMLSDFGTIQSTEKLNAHKNNQVVKNGRGLH